MANVQGTFYSATTQRRGVTPVSPPNAVDDPVDPVSLPIGSHPPVTIGTPANGLSIVPSSQVLSIGLASSGVTGALSGTDWNTFNGKLNLTSPITGYTVGSDTALTETDSILQAFGKVQGQINARVSGTGVVGQVAIFDNTRNIIGYSNVTYDKTNGYLLLGTTDTTITRNELRLFGSTGGLVRFYSGLVNEAIIYTDTNNLQIRPLAATGQTNIWGDGTIRWSILSTGILQSSGAQTIQTSTGNLTLATGGGNGNIILSPNGTGRVSVLKHLDLTLNTLYNSETNSNIVITSSTTFGTARLLLGADNTNDLSYIQSMQNATGWNKNLTLQAMGGNVLIGTILNSGDKLRVNGTVRIDSISNLGTAATSVLVPSATGVVSLRTVSEFRGDLGATTLGANLFTIPNPSAITFPRFNADNTVSALSAGDFRTAIGLGNYVSYSGADSKSASERLQARVNIGSTSATPQIITTAGAINDLSVTSNHLVFTGASVVLSGIVAGLDGEEFTILNASGTNLELLSQSTLSTAGNRFASGVIVPNLSIVRIKYRTTTSRWVLENVGINDGRYVRKDVADSRTGTLTQDGSFNVNGNQIVHTSTLSGDGGSQLLLRDSELTTLFNVDNIGRVTTRNSITVGGQGISIGGAPLIVGGASGISIKGINDGANVFQLFTQTDFLASRYRRTLGFEFYAFDNSTAYGISVFNSSSTRLFSVQGNGSVFANNRSSANNNLTRRDELYLNYSQTVATTGTINDLAINADCKLLILSAADDLTGVVAVDNTRLIRIEARGANRIIRHESTSSTAANRFALGADLTINAGEVYQFIYTDSRWRRVL